MEKLNHQFENISVTKSLIDKLYTKKLINKDTWSFANQLSQNKQSWIPLITRLLAIYSLVLILTGVIHFYSFSWFRFSDAMKFASIESMLIISLSLSLIFGLETNKSKYLLLISSILIGVFLVAFKQVYQTGVESHRLFFIWSLLTIAWTVVSNFAVLWLLWIALINTALILYISTHFSLNSSVIIFTFPILTNSLFLCLRELLTLKKYYWLSPRWTRLVIAIPLTMLLIVPTYIITLKLFDAQSYIQPSTIVGSLAILSTYFLFHYVYNYKIVDRLVVSYNMMSFFISIEILVYNTALKLLPGHYPVILLIMIFITIPLLFLGSVLLKRFYKLPKV